MAFEGNQLPIVGMDAGADLSASQYRFVKIDNTGRVVRASSAAEAVVGVLQNKPGAAGRAAELCAMIGTTKIVAGAALSTLGAFVTTDNEGRAATATSGQLRHGIVRSTAGNAGELATIELGSFGLAP